MVVCTLKETQTVALYSIPNVAYNAISRELERYFGTAMYPKLKPILDKAKLCDLEQYVDIYKYILVI